MQLFARGTVHRFPPQQRFNQWWAVGVGGLRVAIWYKGKGNIGYGANIGSNHTGRLPDQELIPGEGLFFGLGCNIKYPCNFSNAPYSLIASGITTLPQVCSLPPSHVQKVEMPFSLINKPSTNYEGVSPAYNISCVECVVGP